MTVPLSNVRVRGRICCSSREAIEAKVAGPVSAAELNPAPELDLDPFSLEFLVVPSRPALMRQREDMQRKAEVLLDEVLTDVRFDAGS
jgi:hypothetical protein